MGTICVFRLTLELHGHELRDILDDSLGFLLGLCVRALCHWLQGNLGVLAVEAQQHVLWYCLSQGSAFFLQSAADNLLQPRHLGSSRVKKRNYDINLLCREPRAEGAEDKGH
jgi:hypothetical protein